MPLNFRYLDNIPPIPIDLLPEVYKSLLGTNIFVTPNDVYYIYQATPILRDFLSTYFDNQLYNFRVQVIHADTAAHIDHNRNDAINYIVETGGNNVTTSFYDDATVPIESHVINALRWHTLKVCVKHSVNNITHPRIAVTVHIPWNKL